MYWVIEYKNGNVVTEKDIKFSQTDKSEIYRIYFYDEIKPIGFYVDNGLFFIGDMKYDFKVGEGPFLPIQHKTASVIVNNDVRIPEIIAWNVGYLKQDKDFNFKYLLTIDLDRRITLTATKEDKNENILDTKRMQLL